MRLIVFILACILIGGFGFGSVIWLVGLFFDAGWSYMVTVRTVAILYGIISFVAWGCRD